MNNVRDFIQLNMNFLNDIQSYHWQTESYSEHESTGEYYEKFSKLNYSCYYLDELYNSTFTIKQVLIEQI